MACRRCGYVKTWSDSPYCRVCRERMASELLARNPRRYSEPEYAREELTIFDFMPLATPVEPERQPGFHSAPTTLELSSIAVPSGSLVGYTKDEADRFWRWLKWREEGTGGES